MATKNSSMKSLKPGHYVMIDDEPCRVNKVTLSKPGKHGSTKARVDTSGLFDNRKRSILKPADASVTRGLRPAHEPGGLQHLRGQHPGGVEGKAAIRSGCRVLEDWEQGPSQRGLNALHDLEALVRFPGSH